MRMEEVHIDGSMGEGGGQILRSALSLSILSGRPLHLVNLRAGRQKPGLMPQHLQSVKAAAAISGAETQGLEIGSRELRFVPRHLAAGNYKFDIGTAGAASLVLQSVFLPLALAGEESSVTITGGTHVPCSPSFHYLDLQWDPFLRRIGLQVDLELVTAGFYPRGGGCLRSRIGPIKNLQPLQLRERGPLVRIRCLSLVANLPMEIAERQGRQAKARLSDYRRWLQMETAFLPAIGKGTLLLLYAEFARSSACYFALGKRGKPAERVADEAVDALLAFLAGDEAIDEFLADQLVLPLLAVPEESVLRPVRITRHLLTNVDVAGHFQPFPIQVDGNPGETGTIRIRGLPLQRLLISPSFSSTETHARSKSWPKS